MKKIGLFPNTDKDTDFLGTAKVIAFLSGKAEVLIHEELRDKLRFALGDEICGVVRFVVENELFTAPDVMITLGGDGTIIKAARSCSHSRIPILGINFGRIGYLAELELNELHMLDRIIAGDYSIEKRMMIEADMGPERYFALNEAVVGATSIFKMSELELFCDGKKVGKYRADGLIVSTPTGSTAYSMSAGGAVVDPRAEAILVTPICSHSLSATPLIFASCSELEVKNVSLRDEYLVLGIDGVQMCHITYGSSVKIRKSGESVEMIRLKDGGFWDVLHRKISE